MSVNQKERTMTRTNCPVFNSTTRGKYAHLSMILSGENLAVQSAGLNTTFAGSLVSTERGYEASSAKRN